MAQDKDRESFVQRWIDKQKLRETTVNLSVVIPAYNEQWRLPTTLIDIIDYFDKSELTYEIIVVDDGSSDETSEVVHKFERLRSQVRLIRVPTNHGKGYVVRTGVLNAHGDRILFADADGATPFTEVDRLLHELKTGADIAIGSRAIFSEDTEVKTHWHRKYLGRLFNFVVNTVLLPEVADTQCGFKLFSRHAAYFLFEHQTVDGFSFDVEILYIARRAGLNVKEIPINWHNVPGSKVNLVIDASKMLLDVLRFRFLHRDVTPESYHKFLVKGSEGA